MTNDLSSHFLILSQRNNKGSGPFRKLLPSDEKALGTVSYF